MTPLAGIQKKITDRFMCEAIKHHIKKEYFKKGIHPTAEQVMKDIPEEKLDILLQQGYTREEIAGIVGEVIRRQKK